MGINKKIEEDFRNLDEKEIEKFFDNFKNDKRTLSFINYYNRTVLDKERIKFSEFSYQWALHLPKEFYSRFDENYDFLIGEIKSKKNIKEFHNKFCIDARGKRMGSFCSKLFHSILPSEFTPLDTPIRRYFGLQKEEFIEAVMMVKEGYSLFSKEKPELINSVRELLSKDKFSYMRVKEVSDMRLLDMYYWFKENRNKQNIQKPF